MDEETLKKRIEELKKRASVHRREMLPFACILDKVERLEQLYDDLYGV